MWHNITWAIGDTLYLSKLSVCYCSLYVTMWCYAVCLYLHFSLVFLWHGA
jgi:hypothetical protein